MSAFACEPGRGSEPGAGWEFARAGAVFARSHDIRLVLMTRAHRVGELRKALVAEDLAESVMILPVGLPRGVVALTGRRHVRLAYILWQALAVRHVRAVHRRFDVIASHHVTFATLTLPTTFFWAKPPSRIVTGPVNVAARAVTHRAYGRLARAVVSRSAKASDLVVAQNDLVAELIPVHTGTSVTTEPNIVVHRPDEGSLGYSQTDSSMRPTYAICWVGVLEPWKRPLLALDSFACLALENPEVSLLIVGEGPMRREVETHISNLGLEGRVNLLGKLPKDQTLELLAKSDALLFTSAREGAGWVVGEAVTMGTPVVAVDGTGATSVLRRTPGYGLLVPPVGDVAANLASALQDAISRGKMKPSDRWSAGRLPDLLASWYGSSGKD